jgi:hypothetical protein
MKRIAATLLWFYAFWYLGSMIAGLLGVPDLLGPILGPVAAIIVGVDPRGAIWARETPAIPAVPATTRAAATEPGAA